MSLIHQCLTDIPDVLRREAKQYDLPHVLLFSILAVAAGANSLRRISVSIRHHLPRINKAFGSEGKRVPAHTTLFGIYDRLDHGHLAEALKRHREALSQPCPPQGSAETPTADEERCKSDWSAGVLGGIRRW
ncbi:MAG: transposase family protein [Candidatus Competibacterales bacterium]